MMILIEGRRIVTDPVDQNGPRVKIESFSLTGLFVLALFYTAYLARTVLLPLTLALFFAFLLRPVVRALKKKARIPEVIGAALVLLTFLALAGYGISNLSDPARIWITKAPETLHTIGKKLEGIVSPVKKASKTAEELKQLAGEEKQKTAVTVKTGPGLAETIVTGMREFLAQGTVMLILLFFILASGDLFIEKIMKMYRTEETKRRVAEVVNEAEHSISRYLLTVTIINLCEGAVVGLGMYLIGMPDPLLWGAMAALLVYVPYLGPLVGIAIVTVVAFFTLSFKMALLAPLIYLSIEVLQGQFLTPMILGARFAMNPVAIFVWLIIWGSLWGVVGAIIAVPLLAVFRILCDRIASLRPVGEFLSD